MAIVSFGNNGGASGTLNLGRGQHASKYTNSTGGYVTLTELHLYLRSVPSSGSYEYQLAVYNSFPGYPWPYQYLGETQVKLRTAMVVGSNTFLMVGDPVVVRPGEEVWLVFQGSQGGSFYNTGVAQAHVSSTLDTDYAAGEWPEYFLAEPGFLTGHVPIVAYGDDTPPVGTSNVRVPSAMVEPLTGGQADLQVNYVFNEAASEGYPAVAANMIIVEALHPVAPELPMSTEPFPGFGNSSTPSIPSGLDPFNSALPGLAFSVHKKPTFKTNIKEAASGAEVRTSLTEYPRWEFELTYEFLEDRSGAESSLKTIVGFFLSRRGSYDSFLFKDPDDYLADYGYCGDADGLITEFPLRRTYGGFSEKVGQLDEANTLTVYHAIVEDTTIPVTPGPYTVTVANAAAFYRDSGVVKDGTTAMTKVTGSPAAGQYAVDETTGVYTFAAADQGDAIEISYSYEVDNSLYEVTMPNLIVFDSAPSEGQIYASFQFFFACRFVEDQQDFEKFADKLWSLQECNFRSIIQ